MFTSLQPNTQLMTKRNLWIGSCNIDESPPFTHWNESADMLFSWWLDVKWELKLYMTIFSGGGKTDGYYGK